ncbi:hypothetical protein LINPERHAP1_LOCUS24545, partial [Linum perenne]
HLLKTLFSQLLQHFLLINQSFTTLEQGANQSRGAWIEAHNLGRGACKRRIAMVFLLPLREGKGKEGDKDEEGKSGRRRKK